MSIDTEKTSEQTYGIRAQPPPTCPIIDEALDEVQLIAKCIRGYERAGEEELRNMISEIETRIGFLDGYRKTGLLEDIRDNVVKIREWGQEWKDLAKEQAVSIANLSRNDISN